MGADCQSPIEKAMKQRSRLLTILAALWLIVSPLLALLMSVVVHDLTSMRSGVGGLVAIAPSFVISLVLARMARTRDDKLATTLAFVALMITVVIAFTLKLWEGLVLR